MNQEEKQRWMRMLSTPRGAHIMGQALGIAVDVLRERGEESNALDAELLGQKAFPSGYSWEREIRPDLLTMRCDQQNKKT
jgi:hypothetical protein